MPTDPRDYKLDVSGIAPPKSGARVTPQSQPFLSVQFACCGVYRRVYRDPDGRNYRGRCPRCGKEVRFAVGDGGTSSRYFIVS